MNVVLSFFLNHTKFSVGAANRRAARAVNQNRAKVIGTETAGSATVLS